MIRTVSLEVTYFKGFIGIMDLRLMLMVLRYACRSSANVLVKLKNNSCQKVLLLSLLVIIHYKTHGVILALIVDATQATTVSAGQIGLLHANTFCY